MDQVDDSGDGDRLDEEVVSEARSHGEAGEPFGGRLVWKQGSR